MKSIPYFIIFLIISSIYLYKGKVSNINDIIFIKTEDQINVYEAKIALKQKISLKNISEYELEFIPGISSKLSKKIIERKNKIKDLEELKKIKGVGEKTIIKLKKYIK